jgi:hypothetical protein
MLREMHRPALHFSAGSMAFGFCSIAHAQSAADEATKSNNPLNLAQSFNIQNYYTPSVFGLSGHTNDVLLRPTIPVGPGSLVGVPQIFRATVPVSTRPDAAGGYDTGLADINLFDIFLLSQSDIQIGVGPLLTMPTATDPSLGTGKWQAGPAAVAVSATPSRLLGPLLQWQHSFAGQSGRPGAQSLTAQPFGIFNLPEGCTCAPRAPGRSTCSMAAITFRSAWAEAESGKEVQPFSMLLSSRNIRWLILEQASLSSPCLRA